METTELPAHERDSRFRTNRSPEEIAELRAHEWDAVVVGAGPAGATAAYVAARNGLKVLLLEKFALPRVKLCGGAVSNWVKTTLALPDSLFDREIENVQVVVGQEKLFHFPFPRRYRWMLTRRETFDRRLVKMAEAAGATLLEGARVEGVVKERERVTGVATERGPFRAKVVVGADGAHSRVAKSAGFHDLWWGKEDSRKRRAAVPCLDFRVSLPAETVQERFGNNVFFAYDIGAKLGYFWAFPGSDEVNVGIGLLEGGRERLFGMLDDFMLRNPATVPLFEGGRWGRPEGAFVPLLGPVAPTFLPGVLLCGDACHHVDTISGEGIRFAVWGGILAGKTIVRAVRSGDAGADGLREYEDAWQDGFGDFLAMQTDIHEKSANGLAAMQESITRGFQKGKSYFPEVGLDV